MRCIQLTYNNQNELGGSCYEAAGFRPRALRPRGHPRDEPHGNHGRPFPCRQPHDVRRDQLVGEAGRGDACQCRQPVSRTNATRPTTCSRRWRNSGGVLGCATYRNITGDHFCSSVEAWCEMVARTVDIIGIDHVGIGTDRSHGFTKPDYDWMRMGRWTRGIDYGAASAARPGKAPPPDSVRRRCIIWNKSRTGSGVSASSRTRSRRSPAATGSGSTGRSSPDRPLDGPRSRRLA